MRFPSEREQQLSIVIISVTGAIINTILNTGFIPCEFVNILSDHNNVVLTP